MTFLTFINFLSTLLIIGVLFYYIYLTIRKEILPHSFSWLIWGGTTFVIYLAQETEKSGFGSLITLLTSIQCLSVGIVAYFYSAKNLFTKGDWITLILSIIATALWIVTSEPFYAVLLITFADGIAYYPTFRKGHHKPFEDMPFTYFIGAYKFAFSIYLFDEITWTNALFPAFNAIVEFIVFGFLLIRRWQLHKTLSPRSLKKKGLQPHP